MPVVSVIVPTYNRSEVLQQAIKSVLNQIFGDFELIVVDDGSCDDTEPVVRSIPDGRIRYIRQAHGGRSRARNLGMMEAQGEYISLLDDDDTYFPGKLAAQIRFLSKNKGIDLVASGAQIIDHEGNVLKIARPWINRKNPELLYCLSACRFLTCSVLFRRQILATLAQWFDPDLSLAEDLDFWIRLAHAGCRMEWLPEVVCAYHLHNNASFAKSIGYTIACIKLLDGFFKRSDVPESIRDRKNAIYAQRYLFASLRGYAGGISAMGQRFLSEAIRLDPSLVEASRPKLIDVITDYAYGELLDEQEHFIDFIFAQMPASLSHLTQFRKMAFEDFKKLMLRAATA